MARRRLDQNERRVLRSFGETGPLDLPVEDQRIALAGLAHYGLVGTSNGEHYSLTEAGQKELVLLRVSRTDVPWRPATRDLGVAASWLLKV
jgi:hypothetical protein